MVLKNIFSYSSESIKNCYGLMKFSFIKVFPITKIGHLFLSIFEK